MEYLALIYSDQQAWDDASRTTERAAGYEKYAEFANAARAAGVLVGGDELASTTIRDDRPHPRRRAARERRALRGREGGPRWLLHSRLPLVRRRAGLGGAHPRRRDRRDRGSSQSTSTRRPDMKYALLVYSDQSSWEGIDEEEAARRRAESMPRWLTLFEEMGKADPRVEGRELVAASEAKVVRMRRRRARRHRRPVRGDEGADRRPLPHRPARPRRGDPHRGPRAGRRVRLAWRSGLSWRCDRLARGDVPRRVAACRRDPHPRPRRPHARRGRGAGRVRDRARALAARRRPALAGRLDRRDRAERGDRPDPPRADVRAQGRAARAPPGAARPTRTPT